MNKRHASALLTVVIAIAVVIPASAQTTGATLQGTVADEQEAVLREPR